MTFSAVVRSAFCFKGYSARGPTMFRLTPRQPSRQGSVNTGGTLLRMGSVYSNTTASRTSPTKAVITQPRAAESPVYSTAALCSSASPVVRTSGMTTDWETMDEEEKDDNILNQEVSDLGYVNGDNDSFIEDPEIGCWD